MNEITKRRLQKMEALDRIRKAFLNGLAWENLNVNELICYFDDVVTEEIRKL